MTNRYYMPTKVFMGDECILENSEVFKALGKKALIVTGAQSAKRNGSEKDVKNALDSVGIQYQVFDKVMSNPTISCVYEGASAARENGADFIIAIGGGSPLDAAKAIALLAAQTIEEGNLFSGNYQDKVLPMAFVPTTAGTGSEVTQYSILTNDKAQTKTSIASDLIFPTIAFLDARYTEYLGVATTINTAIDALSHVVEGMLSVKASLISDALAAAGIQRIMACVPILLQAVRSGRERVFDLQHRQELLQASFMAGIVIAQTGTTAVHAMGYSLTYFQGIDHGRANGLLLGEYLKLVEKVRPDLAAKILNAMNFSQAEQFLELMNKLLGPKEDISRNDLEQYSKMAVQTKNIANCVVKPSEDDIRTMFIQAFRQ
ncbi:iron-containing alcohol dehydrogenase family protein [Desulfosporosinus sp. PR]|uniref:iron-containing alcohol dehydrogenase family protein n=1 Tax=Candidatus Desulfosporosinus nitrosoreducens TaxID=3401928 RepID=UPI0027F6C50B|nr:iron-containing alcohol dehydrogenase family protein [Desulfosporosinus sp. PR]MDQ7097145.1 iron-containing alcohol dehydrogenase family protein [Desulfosporosinus sp. PR]